MGLAQTLVTVAGIIAIIGLLALLFCHYMGGWTWTKAWLFSSGEEKMVLTRQGTRRHFNPNGYMVSSDSDLNISGRGSFRRFDTTDNDFQLFRQGSNSSFSRYLHHQHLLQQGPNNQIPPQPLRPAPNLPQAPLTSQSSLDSVFNTAPSSPAPTSVPRIPPPPQHTHSGSTSSSVTSHASQRVGNNNSKTATTMGDGNHKKEAAANELNFGGGAVGGDFASISGFAPTNPFLPLLQASSQFISQTVQSFQSGVQQQPQSATALFETNTTTVQVGERTTGAELFCNVKESESTSTAPSSSTTSSFPSLGGGLSMGEILFSAPPMYQHQPVVVSTCGTASPVFSGTPLGSPKPTRAASIPGRTTGSPQHTSSSRYTLYHQNSAENVIGSPSAASGVASPAAQLPNSPTATGSPASIRRASYPNRKEYTPHDTIPKSEFPQHIPYVPSFHHHHHHHAKGTTSTTGGSSSDHLRHHPHHHHYLPSTGVTSSVQPFLEEQEEPPEEPNTNHTLPKATNNPAPSMLDMEREDLTNRIMLETMREEIRIANERMADATKSLMMDDVFLPTSSSQSRSGSPRKRSVETSSNVQVQGGDATSNTKTTTEYAESTTTISRAEGPSHATTAPLTNTNTTTTLTTSINTSSPIFSSRRSSTPLFTNVRTGESSSVYPAGNIGGISGRPTSLLQRSNSSGGRTNETDRLTKSGRESQPEQPLKTSDNQQSSSLSGNNSIMSNVVTAISGIAASSKPPAVGSYLFKQGSRSFSLRQSSTDSIGSESDLGSPPTDGSLPSLQRAMSCDSVCSDTSVILGELDPPHMTGHLCIGLEYDSETADLLVNVMEAKELVGPDPDPHAPFDSYVRVYLLPDKTTNMQTRVYRKSLSPVYKEKFMFGLEMSELASRSLVFYLYATDKYTNTLIGEVELKLADMDLSQPSVTWLMLTDTGQRGGEFGEIMFSLSYLPTAERLTVVVVKARNLKFPHERETGDPFVKVYLLQRGKKVSKKKSSTKRGERNPIFNEAMIFSIPAHALQSIQLRITVADSLEAEGRAYSIGHVIVGSVATGKPLSHWNQMLSSLRKPIAMWHSLRK